MSQSTESLNKVLSLQLEKNLKILEHDYQLMVFRIQTTMNKLTNNNVVLSEIYKEGVHQWCDSIETCMSEFKSLLSECDKLEDALQSVDILAKKINFDRSLFKMMCEDLLKKQGVKLQ